MPQIIRFPQSNRAFKAWDCFGSNPVPQPTGAGFRLRFASITNDAGGRRGRIAIVWWRGNANKYEGEFEFSKNSLKFLSGNLGWGQVQMVNDNGRLCFELVSNGTWGYRAQSVFQMEMTALQSASGVDPTIAFEDVPVQATTGTVVDVIPDRYEEPVKGLDVGQTISQSLYFGMPATKSLNSYPATITADVTPSKGFDYLPGQPIDSGMFNVTPTIPELATMTSDIVVNLFFSVHCAVIGKYAGINVNVRAGGVETRYIESRSMNWDASPKAIATFNFTIRTVCTKSDNYALTFGFKLGQMDGRLDQLRYSKVDDQAIWDAQRRMQGCWVTYGGEA